MRRINGSRALWALALCALLSSCKKSEEDSRTTEADASVDKDPSPALDPELAEAMAAASVGAPAAAPPQTAGGPPPNGILGIEAANEAAKKGSLPTLELGNEGSAPKVTFSQPRLEAGTKLSGKIQVVVQQGQQGGLPVEFLINLEAQKPKEGEGPKDALKMLARVADASVAVPGAGEDLESAVAKLKGARVQYYVVPNGAGTGYTVEPPKGITADLAPWLESLRDTLALVTLPMPSKPVGTGAYWMVTSREGVLGLDLVSYRLVKLEAVKDGVATLSVNAKRYAATDELDMLGLPPNAPRKMQQFESASEARLEYRTSVGFPSGGDIKSALAIGLGEVAAARPNQPRQQQGLMIQSRVVLSFAPPAAK